MNIPNPKVGWRARAALAASPTGTARLDPPTIVNAAHVPPLTSHDNYALAAGPCICEACQQLRARPTGTGQETPR